MKWMAVLPLLLSCGPEDQAATLGGDVIELRIEPESLVVEVSPDQPLDLEFVAYATFKDGREEPLELVTWASSNLSAGDIDSAGIFTTVDSNGGVTEVSATHLEISATADLKIIYVDDIVVEGVDEAVVSAMYDSEATSNDELVLEYPPDGATVPRNLEGLGFMWPMPEDASIARLHFTTEITDVSVYLSDEQWLASAELFSLIAAANRGGAVDVAVETATWDGSTLSNHSRGPSATLNVNRLDARGSVLYWGSNLEAIMRIPFGSLDAEEFWTKDDSGGQCTGCHIASNESHLMVVSHGGIDGRFSVIDIEDPDNPTLQVDAPDEPRVTFKTLSNDGERVVGANLKELLVLDATDGTLLETFEHELPLTQPDMSPDGDYVVAVRAQGRWNSDFNFLQGELVRIPWDGETLGEPEILLAASDEYNYYYPAYAPDGNWIAFNRSATAGPYAAVDAELMLMHESGGDPIVLGVANGEPDQQNSFPRWGPLPDDDVLWLAYSSTRTYPLENTRAPQVWVAGIDTTLADQGLDPSKPPFWLPGQNPSSDNHLPFWWSK